MKKLVDLRIVKFVERVQIRKNNEASLYWAAHKKV